MIVIVIGPVIVAVHVNGNATVCVIEPVRPRTGPRKRRAKRHPCFRLHMFPLTQGERPTQAQTGLDRRMSITPTVAFPFTCTATITGPPTTTVTITATITGFGGQGS